MQVYNTADLLYKFPVSRVNWESRLTVSGSKVLVLHDQVVDVYEQHGKVFVVLARESSSMQQISLLLMMAASW